MKLFTTITNHWHLCWLTSANHLPVWCCA